MITKEELTQDVLDIGNEVRASQAKISISANIQYVT